tara:strand:+ start:106 stop:423 length:318 start_codon:yes stop_codon:yes gene_type:complete
MALKGSITYKGITVADTHAVVIRANHDCNYSINQEDNSVVKTLSANALVRFYKDAATYAAGVGNHYDQVEITFTPSVGNGVNLNIIKQTYEAMKAMDAYKDMTDV